MSSDSSVDVSNAQPQEYSDGSTTGTPAAPQPHERQTSRIESPQPNFDASDSSGPVDNVTSPPVDVPRPIELTGQEEYDIDFSDISDTGFEGPPGSGHSRRSSTIPLPGYGDDEERLHFRVPLVRGSLEESHTISALQSSNLPGAHSRPRRPLTPILDVDPAQNPLSDQPDPLTDDEDQIGDPPAETRQNDLTTTAHFLFDHICHFKGCSAFAHQDREAELEADRGARPVLGLAAIIPPDPKLVVDVLKSPKMADEYDIPTDCLQADYLRATFEGVSVDLVGDTSGPPIISLGKYDNGNPKATQIQFDVDSWSGKVLSLSAFRKGLKFYIYPPRSQNITSSIPEFTDENEDEGEGLPNDPGEESAERAEFSVHKTVHFLLADVVGSYEQKVYVVVPGIPLYKGRTNYLRDHDLALWYERAWIPAINDVCPSDVSQHYRKTFDLAKRTATAARREGHKRRNDKAQPVQMITDVLKSEFLADVWTNIEHRISTDEHLAAFRGCRLFLNAKNMKLYFKKPSPHECIRFFYQEFDTAVDRAQLEDFRIDFAWERISTATTPSTSLLRHCCLRSFLTELFGLTDEGNIAGPHQYFWHGFLGQAANMNFRLPRKHNHYRGGLRKGQAYCQRKAPLDAVKRMPFANPAVEELALDTGFRSAVNSAGSTTSNPELQRSNWSETKLRYASALNSSMDTAFSERNEFTVLDSLLDSIATLSEASWSTQYEPMITHVYVIPTNDLFKFFYFNTNKYCFLFEAIASRCKGHSTPNETKLMVMAMQLASASVPALNYTRRADFWRGSETYKDANGELYEHIGLNFEYTMAEFNYAWLPDYFDWKRLRIRTNVVRQMGFQSLYFLRRVRGREQPIQDLEDYSQDMERCVDILRDCKYREAQHLVMVYMVHIVLRSWRDEVRRIVRQDVHTSIESTLDDDTVQLCYDDFRRVLGGRVHLTHGNRAKFKDFKSLYANLFGGVSDLHATEERLHFHNRGYRVLARNGEAGFVEAYRGSKAHDRWLSRLTKELVRYHWIYPAPEPCRGMLQQRSSLQERMWFSLILVDDAKRKDNKDYGCFWGQKRWQRGKPKPPYSDLSIEDLEERVRGLEHTYQERETAGEEGLPPP